MVWIGITGSIASGKTAVQQIIENKGYPVIDADELARRAVAKGSQGLEEVLQTFGENFRGSDGELDRKKLGEVVFSDPEKLSQLEKIVHPFVRKEFQIEKERFSDEGYKVGFYVVPLLFEKNMEDQFENILVISVDPDTQLKRIIERDSVTEEQARNVISNQMPDNEKVELGDFVVRNNGSIEELRSEIDKFLFSIPGPRQS